MKTDISIKSLEPNMDTRNILNRAITDIKEAKDVTIFDHAEDMDREILGNI